ncbi:class I histocompatibility antigen, F10 alpha chain-like isoform X2 [Carassius auratus]|uniref:Class I histocompatibility antigen, F10 alpha chain-like isoform X2 n=1 Tax=Carassius auratus TaxID=7957 RepID=A0A6P6RIK0_CARAU|nr:class I histocompatibility antigen, F10 alpha chain-like isoform X2 [Carassius auratus]
MRSVVLLLLGVHLANAATHSLQYFYTTTTGIPNFPRFVDVGMLNGEVISMYDSTSQRKIPKQKWMAENLDQQYWDSGTENIKGTEQAFMNNIQVAMIRFNQTAGVHTVQLMYGCEFDDQTGETNGFRQYGYDGEDFLFLDLKEMRWISPVKQGALTVDKLNKDKAVLEGHRNYFSTVCIEWLKKYLEYGKSSLKKTVSPQVSVLKRSSSSQAVCQATGFHPKDVTISWMKNDQEHHEDVEVGQPLPNEDGTFQKTSTITVTAEELKKNQFSCVVEHQGETFREILKDGSPPIGIIVGVVVAVILLAVIGVVVFKVYQKKKGFKPVNASDNGSNSSARTDPQA